MIKRKFMSPSSSNRVLKNYNALLSPITAAVASQLFLLFLSQRRVNKNSLNLFKKNYTCGMRIENRD